MCVYFDRQAIEKLQTNMERKTDIERALRENKKHQSKAPRVRLPRRCREKSQEQDRKKEMAALDFRSMHNEVPIVWLKEHFEVDERPSQIEGQGAFLKRGTRKGKTVYTSVSPSSEFNDGFSIEQYDCAIM